MMVPCACCGVVCEPEPYFRLSFATHAGPLCPDCWNAWRDPQRTCRMTELPIYQPVMDANDPRLWWRDDAHWGS